MPCVTVLEGVITDGMRVLFGFARGFGLWQLLDHKNSTVVLGSL